MAEPNNSHTFNSPKGSKTSSNLESKPIDSHSSSSRPESSSTRAIRPPHAFYPHNHDTSINSSQHNNNLTNDHNNMDKYNTHIDRVSDSSSANETHHDSLDHSSSPHKLSNSYYSSSSQVSSDVSPNCDTSNASPDTKNTSHTVGSPSAAPDTEPEAVTSSQNMDPDSASASLYPPLASHYPGNPAENPHSLTPQHYYATPSFIPAPMNIDPTFPLNFNSLGYRDGYNSFNNNWGYYRQYNYPNNYNNYNNNYNKYNNNNHTKNNNYYNYKHYNNYNNNRYGYKNQSNSMYHVYIGNIPFTTQWQELKDHLRTAGDVYRVEIPESYDGRPKGFALATYFTKQGAQNAIDTFNNTQFQGRELTVRFDRFGNNPDLEIEAHNDEFHDAAENENETSTNSKDDTNETEENNQDSVQPTNDEKEQQTDPQPVDNEKFKHANSNDNTGNRSLKTNYRNNYNRYYRNNNYYNNNNNNYYNQRYKNNRGGLYLNNQQVANQKNFQQYMYFSSNVANSFIPNALNSLGTVSPSRSDYSDGPQSYPGFDPVATISSPSSPLPLPSSGVQTPIIGNVPLGNAGSNSANSPHTTQGFVPNQFTQVLSKPFTDLTPFSPKEGYAQFAPLGNPHTMAGGIPNAAGPNVNMAGFNGYPGIPVPYDANGHTPVGSISTPVGSPGPPNGIPMAVYPDPNIGLYNLFPPHYQHHQQHYHHNNLHSPKRVNNIRDAGTGFGTPIHPGTPMMMSPLISMPMMDATNPMNLNSMMMGLNSANLMEAQNYNYMMEMNASGSNDNGREEYNSGNQYYDQDEYTTPNDEEESTENKKQVKKNEKR